MKTILTALLLALCVVLPIGAQEMRFEPYDPEAPPARVDGSIRGAEGSLAIDVLAPPSLAVTAQASPTLYWFASATVEDPVELVLIEEGGTEALAEVVLEPPLDAGVHAFPLPASLELETGRSYQWSVAVVPDPEARSNDIFASALLERVPVPATLATADSRLERASRYAELGLWYDAVDALYPDDESNAGAELRQARASLLEQAGLNAIADFERQEK